MNLKDWHIIDLRKIYIDFYFWQILFWLVGAILVMIALKIPQFIDDYHYQLNLYIAGGICMFIGMCYTLAAMVFLNAIMKHEDGKKNWKIITGFFINSFAISEVYKL